MRMLIFIKVMILVLFINVSIIQQCACQGFGSESPNGYLTLQVFSDGNTTRHQDTNVNVSKTVMGTGPTLRFKYDIQTPRVDDFYLVLALDSSGSMGYGGNSKQADAVIYAVPKFLEETVSAYKDKKNISVSVLSWDDDIDFAYSDVNNRIPRNAKVVKVEKAQKEMNESVFGNGEVDTDGYYYRCSENDHTNLSKALEASIEILDNNPENYYHRTSKFIILVTGASEYENCSKDLLELANKKGYPIYVIGMDLINEKSNMLRDLRTLSGDKDRRFQNLLSIGEDLKEDLLIALNKALENATLEPVAEDVRLVESFYSYIVPRENAYARVIGYPEYDSLINVTRNNDSTVSFALPDGLLADNITEITLDADLVLGKIPVSASDESKPLIFSPLSNNTRSYVSYNWLRKKQIDLDLPEVSVNVQSGASNKMPSKEGNMVSPKGDPIGNSKEERKETGHNFGVLTFLSFSVILVLMRKNF